MEKRHLCLIGGPARAGQRVQEEGFRFGVPLLLSVQLPACPAEIAEVPVVPQLFMHSSSEAVPSSLHTITGQLHTSLRERMDIEKSGAFRFFNGIPYIPRQ